jgi:ABC-type nitrate/sulfonate/bicarbonate transport system substrate-binding protein
MLWLWPVVGAAQTPRANGETLNIQNYAATTGNMHAIVAKAKGFCDKYNFKCEIKTINSTSLGLQALIGKTIDVVQGGADLTAGAVLAGGDVRIVGLSLPANVLSVSVRNDVPLPNRAKGYPGIMKDFKGLKVGITARGTSSEKYFNAMLADGGLQPNDVTYVAVGGPATSYAALAVGKQIDAVVMFQPLPQLCQFNKTCETVVDMTVGEGPASLASTIGSNVIFAMRRETADGNPQLMAAYYAAMRDAANWFNDPANFEELVKIFTPLISFGDMPGADELRRSWIKSVIPAYSKDLVVKKSALQAIIDFAVETKGIDGPIEAGKVLWDKAPQTP